MMRTSLKAINPRRLSSMIILFHVLSLLDTRIYDASEAIFGAKSDPYNNLEQHSISAH